MSTKFKNQITSDEIKNKIKLETTNVNKKITSKRREIESKEKDNWRAGLIFSMVCTQIQEKRKGKEKKNHFQRTTTIHASSRKEKDVEMDLMMQEKH